ncbi:hypothetical protein [Shewanella algicola]|uniref:Lipoprotein n=1 Tax=Shewanella algicola TaxID=640633 RepID=A0A9X1Z9I8_9GAMM|nr:hypothetical protein [Shewanella algicola]MCL1107854.1 hypothetical protein [Shewanella algicola]
MRIILISILAFSLFGCASHSESIFIPASPLTQEEIDAEKERFRNDPEWADIDVEEMIGDGKGMYTYREKDIRSALKGIEDSDERLSLCSNSIMSGATSIVFLGKTNEPNRVNLKTASCGPVKGGLACQPMKSNWKHQYKDIYFNAGMLRYEKALKVILAFEERGIENLPDWHRKMFGVNSVNSVEETMNGYLIGVGELFCGGCVAKILVKPTLDENSEITKLTYVDAIGSICI